MGFARLRATSLAVHLLTFTVRVGEATHRAVILKPVVAFGAGGEVHARDGDGEGRQKARPARRQLG